MTEEQKEKYANFLDKVSEILGLNKPVDILRLCAVTDEYFKPIEQRIAELEKENIELKVKVGLSIDCEKAQRNGELWYECPKEYGLIFKSEEELTPRYKEEK